MESGGKVARAGARAGDGDLAGAPVEPAAAPDNGQAGGRPRLVECDEVGRGVRSAPRRDGERHGPGPDSASRGRPRRILRLETRNIVIRRELTREGYLLRFTGRDSTCALLDLVLEEIERMFAPG